MSGCIHVVEGPKFSDLRTVGETMSIFCSDGKRGFVRHLVDRKKQLRRKGCRISILTCPTQKSMAVELLQTGGFQPLCLCETFSMAGQHSDLLAQFIPEDVHRGSVFFICLGSEVLSTKSPDLIFTPLVIRNMGRDDLVQVSPLSHLNSTKAGFKPAPLMPQWRILAVRA
jgi:hypothetical protein